MNVRARATYLRNVVSRRSSAPQELKRLVTAVRKAETKERENRRLFHVFKKDHRAILKVHRLKRSQTWRDRSKVNEALHVLGMMGLEDLDVGGEQITFFSARIRARYLRRVVSRNRNAPEALKKMVATVRRAEESQRSNRKAFLEWKRGHKEILSRYNRLQSQIFCCERKIRDSKRVLGLYDAPGLSLPRVTGHYDQRY